MLRSTYNTRIVLQDGLMDNAWQMGELWKRKMQQLAINSGLQIQNVRGKGLILAFDCETTEERDAMVQGLYEDHDMLVLGCGPRTVRFRPNLAVTEEDILEGCTRVGRYLSQ